MALMREDLKDSIGFYNFVQYIFFKQWNALKGYANKNGIQIIGDAPIFVAYDSADVWANPHLFNLDQDGYPLEVAGVPPDYFSKSGQLWGNPTYNWDEHMNTNYSWWIARIKKQLETCDMIRIDHFRGFESYYSIPFGSIDAKKGKWIKGLGADFFNCLIKELGTLPIIAEDLGIITEEVTRLVQSFDLPGMKVLQFAFDNSKNNPYLPHNYDKNCVVYTGTHDNDTTVGWYNTANESEKDLFRRYISTDGISPSWDLIRLAIASTATYAVYPLQDVLCLDSNSRMNTPGVESGNWKWRYTENMLLDSHSQNLKYLTELFKR